MSINRQNTTQFGEVDWVLLGLYVALVAIGWLMIYAVNYDPNAPYSFFNLSQSAGKQMFFMLLCLVMIFFIMLTDWSLWRTFGLTIYLISIIILPGTLIFGREINGALAWYQFGGFSFQPAEIAKFGTCLAMASYLSSTGVDLRQWRSRFIAGSIFLLPIGIILLQQDTGSALVFFSFMLVLYREGLSPTWYILGFGTAAMVILGLIYEPPLVAAWLIAIVNYRLIARFRERTQVWWGVFIALALLTFWWKPAFSWFLEQSNLDYDNLPYAGAMVMIPQLILFLAAFLPSYLRKNSIKQRELQVTLLILTLSCALVFAANFACYTLLAPHQQARIKTWLKPGDNAADARGAAYNLVHSKMAIGSGGFAGKGFLEGNMTKLKYVPEQSTDFIFCTVGEEQGFIGVLAVIILFSLLLHRMTVIAERQRSKFSRIYAYCVTGIIFFHFMINIGMTMGLFPIIGIPLPFISAGGSSLIGFSLMIGVLLKLDSNRNLA